MSKALEFPIDGLTETALEISRARRNTLMLAKQAVRQGNLKEADRLLTELVPDEELPKTEKKKTGKFRLVARL